VRAEFLPAASGARARTLLKLYLDQRILFYTTPGGHQLLQKEMWSATIGPTSENPTPVAALIAQVMTDVLNSQGYAQAAYKNYQCPVQRSISYLARDRRGCAFGFYQFFLAFRAGVGLAVISLVLIANIDSAHRGVIRVKPQNLETNASNKAALAIPCHFCQFLIPHS